MCCAFLPKLCQFLELLPRQLLFASMSPSNLKGTVSVCKKFSWHCPFKTCHFVDYFSPRQLNCVNSKLYIHEAGAKYNFEHYGWFCSKNEAYIYVRLPLTNIVPSPGSFNNEVGGRENRQILYLCTYSIVLVVHMWWYKKKQRRMLIDDWKVEKRREWWW